MDPDRRDKRRWHSTTYSTIANEFPPKAPMDMSLCMSCKGRHSLATCKAFLEKPFKERQDLYMTRGICFSCLNPGQMYGGQKGSICQNTKQCLKAQTNFQKHKSVYQNTTHFLKNTTNFSNQKLIYQNTNQFTKTQTNFPETQTKRLGTYAVIIRESLNFSASNMATVLTCD